MKRGKAAGCDNIETAQTGHYFIVQYAQLTAALLLKVLFNAIYYKVPGRNGDKSQRRQQNGDNRNGDT